MNFGRDWHPASHVHTIIIGAYDLNEHAKTWCLRQSKRNSRLDRPGNGLGKWPTLRARERPCKRNEDLQLYKTSDCEVKIEGSAQLLDPKVNVARKSYTKEVPGPSAVVAERATTTMQPSSHIFCTLVLALALHI